MTTEFTHCNIMIIGDVMIDHYIDGSVSRISPEAPVPVVHVKEEYDRLGGAANVAANIASLGAKATLVCVVGDDAGKERFRKLLGNVKAAIIVDEGRPTTIKTRVISRNQQLLRLDYEDGKPICENTENAIIKVLTERKPDVVALSDYNKGLLTPTLIRRIIEHCNKEGIKTVLDPKPSIIEHCTGIYLVKPNNLEACQWAGLPRQNGEQIKEIGKRMADELHSNILITRGEKGMVLFEKGTDILEIPTEARHVYDVTGAGDTVTAVLAVALAAGKSLEESTRLANSAAGIVVGKAGTETLSIEELKSKT